MKTENVVLMKMARESLRDKWGLAIGTFLVYFIIIGAFQAPMNMYANTGLHFAVLPLVLIIGGPFALGISIFSLAISRGQDARIEQLFKGFNNFGTSLGAYLLMLLFVFLWSLLLIIPGIIAGLSYSMTFFIIADDNNIGSMEAIDKSKSMMMGYKWKLFRLYLRFFGWGLLCILTLGIGFLWLMPYMQVTMAKFYEDLKKSPLESYAI